MGIGIATVISEKGAPVSMGGGKGAQARITSPHRAETNTRGNLTLAVVCSGYRQVVSGGADVTSAELSRRSLQVSSADTPPQTDREGLLQSLDS